MLLLRRAFPIVVFAVLFSLLLMGPFGHEAAACELVADFHGGSAWLVCNGGDWAMEWWLFLMLLLSAF